jgi:hypothetical protein
MNSDVLCMALANAPSGEQMSRFLAVGLTDETVRIISLDTTVSVDLLLYVSNILILKINLLFKGLFSTIKNASDTSYARIIMYCRNGC